MTERVLIIGGGPAALSAAFELTVPELRQEDGQPRYEVTVLQPGWRLGGKCASGRNAAVHDRIEEHGLHVWFGCYDNGFDLMRRCYDELARDSRHAFRSVEDAFHGIDTIILGQRRNGDWGWPEVTFPRDPVPPINFMAFAVEALNWVARRLVELQPASDLRSPVGATFAGLDLGLGDPTMLLEEWLGHAISRLQRRVGMILANVALAGTDEFLELLDQLGEVVERVLPSALRSDADVIFFCDTFDLLMATLKGVWTDDVLNTGCDALNDKELSQWLTEHGATLSSDPLEWPALLRAVYDGCFAFVAGDPSRPSIAAGRALQGVIRCMFHYRGSVIFRMRAGMGDAVIAPLYEALAARGVDFRFFHAAEEVIPNGDGTAVAEVRVARQVDVAPFDPLITVDYGDGKILRCWPSDPPDGVLDAQQLAHKDELEFDINPLGGATEVLRAGTDFHHVVLAVPPDVQKRICGRLRDASPPYAAMLDNSHSVITQAMQLWLTCPADDLDQAFITGSIMTGFVEPVNTYCDMSDLVSAERWPDGTVQHIAYFCGVLADDGVLTQADADTAARVHCRQYLDEDVRHAWRSPSMLGSAAGSHGSGTSSGAGTAQGFAWDLLYPPDTSPIGTGPANGSSSVTADPLARQYVRANWAPTERYLLSLPGTIDKRLEPGQSGFSNLVLAGDWTRSGFDAGCVEAAVTSGRMAAAAICADIGRRPPVGLDGPSGFPNTIPARRRSGRPAAGDERSIGGFVRSTAGSTLALASGLAGRWKEWLEGWRRDRSRRRRQ